MNTENTFSSPEFVAALSNIINNILWIVLFYLFVCIDMSRKNMLRILCVCFLITKLYHFNDWKPPEMGRWWEVVFQLSPREYFNWWHERMLDATFSFLSLMDDLSIVWLHVYMALGEMLWWCLRNIK
jgi:hypothetical protein